MIEKLCQRFPTTDDVRQWRKLAYCLSLCNFNEKGVKRIAECFKCFGNTLGDETVHSYFQVQRVRSRVCLSPAPCACAMAFGACGLGVADCSKCFPKRASLPSRTPRRRRTTSRRSSTLR